MVENFLPIKVKITFMEVFSQVVFKKSLSRFKKPGRIELATYTAAILLAEKTLESLRGLYSVGLIK